MISLDTNILLYALNADCSENKNARHFLNELSSNKNVVVCELVLVELYLLLRNPAVIKKALSATKAAALCNSFRNHPRWRLVDCAPIMTKVWQLATHKNFARRRIIDARLAFTLLHHGVTEFATHNVADFADFGFSKVSDPIENKYS
ncbi:MAG: PIN domain-containing protein [Deltaproteobacteria bacterium]|nr:PIN domain-containing protein [Deltaproteobacteria bacterium]